MKVSIWRQFSSNHSSYFTVMGRFRTHEEALKVAEELREFQRQVSASEYVDTDWGPWTIAEFEFADKHNIDWGDNPSTNWLFGSYTMDDLIQVLGQDVLWMSNDTEIWREESPFRAVLVRFGATQAVYQSQFTSAINIVLSFNTPNDEVNQSVWETLKAYQVYLYKTQNGRKFDYRTYEKPDEVWRPADAPSLDVEEEPYWNYYYQVNSIRHLHQADDCISLHLRFERVGYGLPAMVNWLESLGCTNVLFEYSEAGSTYKTDEADVEDYLD